MSSSDSLPPPGGQNQRTGQPLRPPTPARTEPLPIVSSPWLSGIALGLDSASDAPAREAIIAAVWQRVAEEGTPILEESSEDGCLTTFVYRLDTGEEAADILLMAGGIFDPLDPTASRLHRVPETDIGHLSLLMPHDWRACYSFATLAADDDLSDPFVMRTLRMSSEVDENARRFIPAKAHGDVRSVVELPGATPQPWMNPREDTSPPLIYGTVSDGEGRERQLWLHEPPVAAEQVLIVLDGDKWAETLPLTHTLANLMADGSMPPTATVFVEPLDIAGRWIELGCSGDFLDFLADTVLPWVRARGVAPAISGRDVVVCGQSLGGLTALYAALSRPDTFGQAIAQSPSLWWGPGAEPTHWLTSRLSDGDLPAPGTHEPRVALQYGAHEAVIDESVQRFLPVAGVFSLDVSVQRFTGGHDDAWWWGGIGQALIDLATRD